MTTNSANRPTLLESEDPTRDDHGCYCVNCSGHWPIANACLLTAARADRAALLARIEGLTRALEFAREACRKNLVKFAEKNEPLLLETFHRANLALAAHGTLTGDKP